MPLIRHIMPHPRGARSTQTAGPSRGDAERRAHERGGVGEVLIEHVRRVAGDGRLARSAASASTTAARSLRGDPRRVVERVLGVRVIVSSSGASTPSSSESVPASTFSYSMSSRSSPVATSPASACTACDPVADGRHLLAADQQPEAEARATPTTTAAITTARRRRARPRRTGPSALPPDEVGDVVAPRRTGWSPRRTRPARSSRRPSMIHTVGRRVTGPAVADVPLDGRGERRPRRCTLALDAMHLVAVAVEHARSRGRRATSQ